MNNARHQFLQDTLLVEELVRDSKVKTASGLTSSIGSWISDYISAHIDPKNKVASVLNLLVPGIMYAMGFKWMSILLEAAEQIFGFSLTGIFSSIIDAITGPLHDGTITPEHIDQAAKGAVLGGSVAASVSLREVQLLKLTWIDLLHSPKTKISRASFFDLLRGKTGSILWRVIAWIFKAALSAAGLMVLGDAGAKLMGKPSPLSANPLAPSPSSEYVPVSSTQTTFKPAPDYHPEKLNITGYWIETVPPEEIGNTIADWVQAIYPDTKGLDSQIRSTSGFQKAVDAIQDYNKTNSGNYTFIPKEFTSRKQIVDSFMDELAEKAPAKGPPTTNVQYK
jgi:hypothetical protein